jgi:cellulose biosynthesis protein BcsQ
VAEPLILALASHKGGTGRTTTALTLAWSLGHSGHRTIFVDADEQQSAALLALNSQGVCSWPNVTFRRQADTLDEPIDADVVIVDPPALTAESAAKVLQRVHGVILTSLADPMSIRTVPAAAAVIEQTKSINPRLELLGLLICMYRPEDPVQSAMLVRLHQAHRDLLLDPVIPFQASWRDWALHPGTPPFDGPARAAVMTFSQHLAPILASV